MRNKNATRREKDHLHLLRYLVVSERGDTRLSVGKPALKASDIAIQIHLNVPLAVFRKPQLEATITIPEEAGAPDTLTAATTEAMSDAVKQATGLTLDIRVVNPTPPETRS